MAGRASPEGTLAESFAHAWDRVLSLPRWECAEAPREDFRKVTTATLMARLDRGLVQPVVYRGALAGIRTKPDISTLLRVVRRTERGPACPHERG